MPSETEQHITSLDGHVINKVHYSLPIQLCFKLKKNLGFFSQLDVQLHQLHAWYYRADSLR